MCQQKGRHVGQRSLISYVGEVESIRGDEEGHLKASGSASRLRRSASPTLIPVTSLYDVRAPACMVDEFSLLILCQAGMLQDIGGLTVCKALQRRGGKRLDNEHSLKTPLTFPEALCKTLMERMKMWR